MTHEEAEQVLEYMESKGEVRKTGEFRDGRPVYRLTTLGQIRARWSGALNWIKRTCSFARALYLLCTREVSVSVDGTDPKLPYEVGVILAGRKFFALAKFRSQREAEDIGFYSPGPALLWECWKQRRLFS
jgi:hypothetical protein